MGRTATVHVRCADQVRRACAESSRITFPIRNMPSLRRTAAVLGSKESLQSAVKGSRSRPVKTRIHRRTNRQQAGSVAEWKAAEAHASRSATWFSKSLVLKAMYSCMPERSALVGMNSSYRSLRSQGGAYTRGRVCHTLILAGSDHSLRPSGPAASFRPHPSSSWPARSPGCTPCGRRDTARWRCCCAWRRPAPCG